MIKVSIAPEFNSSHLKVKLTLIIVRFFYSSELFQVKGLQVAPAELEALLLEHPGIADAAVTSIPDEKSGELPLGFIVKKPDSNITEEQVREFVAGRF